MRIGYDDRLFISLYDCVVSRKERDVALVEQRKLLPSARYYRALVPEIRSEREAYFKVMFHEFEGLDLVFFDPDNGLEVPSKPYKGKPSRKHVYFRDLKLALERRRSFLVIQFFPRRPREAYINERVSELKRHVGAERVLCLRTANIVYFLALHPAADAETLTSRVESACKKWFGQTELCASAPLCDGALSLGTS